MANEIAIRVENVSKDFQFSTNRANSIKSLFTGVFKNSDSKRKTQHALRSVSFDIQKGEFFGIVGRNGSGKSTLLKMLAGIYQPNKGSINVNGKLVPFIELGVGFNPELTGRENVYLNGALNGFSTRDVDGFYDSVVEFAELEKFMDQKLKNYSSGMQVRLAFSVAIQAKADILLIDEVLAVGDADFQRKCFEYFNYLKKSDTTVVFVSHDMEAVRQYCDRAILIEDSKLVDIGRAEKIALGYIRQFNNQETETALNSEVDEKRWGDFSAMFDKVSIKSTSKSIAIQTEITTKKKLEGCIVGIRLKTSAGMHITGTNTKLEHKPINDLSKGEKVKLTWEMPNILSDGKYMIDAAITYQDEITVLDWWEDAASVKIKKDRQIPYSVDPGFTLEVD